MSTLSAEKYQEIALAAAKKKAADYERGWKQDLADGWELWRMGPPSKRRAGYLACTWPEDYMWIMTDGYYDGRLAGAFPELRAVIEYQKVTQPVPDGRGGQTIPVPPDMRPYVWARWISCPKEVFEFFARDFKRLVQDAIE